MGAGVGTEVSRSAAVIRPPGPVPMVAARSIPRSRASFRVAGEALGRFPEVVLPVAASEVVAVTTGVGASGMAGSPTEPSSISMRTSPTWRRSPSAPPRVRTTPATGDGNSELALSVRTSTSAWSRTTVSPGRTSHSTISASSRPSPMSGRRKTCGMFPGVPAGGSAAQATSRTRRTAAAIRSSSGM